MKAVGVLQPGYLPWLGFFDQLDQADIFILYDDVQYDKNGWRNRNLIKTAQGIQWITVPVLTKRKEFQLVKDTVINNTDNWQKKNVLSITQNYKKAKYSYIAEDICTIIQGKEWRWLVDLNYSLLKKLLVHLGIDKPVYFSSDFNTSVGKNEKIISLIKHFGGDTFIEGSSGKNYIDIEQFKKNSIVVSYQEYNHPVYNQLYGKFIPYLSVLDLLCNCGPNSLEIIRSGRCQVNTY